MQWTKQSALCIFNLRIFGDSEVFVGRGLAVEFMQRCSSNSHAPMHMLPHRRMALGLWVANVRRQAGSKLQQVCLQACRHQQVWT